MEDQRQLGIESTPKMR